MRAIQREIALCLQYFGPMTGQQIVEKINLRKPDSEKLSLHGIQCVLDSITGNKITNPLRVNNGVYTCNRWVGKL